MAAPNSVRITNGALDEMPGSSDSIVIRGVLDPYGLQLLQTADYQREIAPLSKISELVKALESGRVPDIELGMRGDRVIEREGVFFLHDPVFVVDGLQRVTAAKQLINKGGKPRLGALVHLNTSEAWERERFRILNAERMKVSPNILLRNARKTVQAVQAVFQLTGDKDFVLYDRVCWTQRMRRQDLITALTMFKTVGVLHAHLGPGRSSNLGDLTRGLQKVSDKIGKHVLLDNIRAFFSLVDQCWGIKRVAFKEGAVYLRSSFLWCLAAILSRHVDFWRGDGDNRLFIEASLMRKIALFPVADPEVARLASAGGKARELLQILMLDHINSGKRTKRLKARVDVDAPTPSETKEQETVLAAAAS